MAVREYQKKRRRERIFRAAMELFRNRGFQETTATEIAKAPPEPPSPMMVVMMGTSSWAISKILRPMASD